MSKAVRELKGYVNDVVKNIEEIEKETSTGIQSLHALAHKISENGSELVRAMENLSDAEYGELVKVGKNSSGRAKEVWDLLEEEISSVELLESWRESKGRRLAGLSVIAVQYANQLKMFRKKLVEFHEFPNRKEAVNILKRIIEDHLDREVKLQIGLEIGSLKKAREAAEE